MGLGMGVVILAEQNPNCGAYPSEHGILNTLKPPDITDMPASADACTKQMNSVHSAHFARAYSIHSTPWRENADRITEDERI